MSVADERAAYCAMCAHSAPRHKAEGHRRSRFPFVCLVVARAVTARGIPLSVNSEIYPCGWAKGQPIAFERSESCEADETDLIPFVRADSDDYDVDYIHVMECSKCGGTYEHVNGSYEFCPRCSRKVVDERNDV